MAFPKKNKRKPKRVVASPDKGGAFAPSVVSVSVHSDGRFVYWRRYGGEVDVGGVRCEVLVGSTNLGASTPYSEVLGVAVVAVLD